MTEADLPERPEFENPDLDAARIDQQNSGSMAGGQQGIVGNYNTQTQTQYIYNYGAESAKAQRPRNEKILLDAVKQEVNQRLKQSLHQAVLIQLQMDTQPEQVEPNRLWEAEVKIGTRPPEPLPVNATIQDVFDQEEIAHKLLILGAPGSGKTTTMLDLAKALVNRAEQDANHPIPVMFNLSSWTNDQQSIKDWLLVELKLKYGVRQTVGEQWIEEKALIPLLDGLDELVGERQERCVSRINQFLQSEDQPTQVLVCSRLEEYSNYQIKLNLNGAICLCPLTDQQLDQYFIQLPQIRLQQVLSTNADLRELIHTPLWLSISILAIDELNVSKWQQEGSLEIQREQLLDAYVRQMMHRQITSNCYTKEKEPSVKQRRKWLVILARQLQEQTVGEFAIEEMQPRNWLKTDKLQWQYRCLLGLIGGLVLGIIMSQIVNPIKGLFLGVLIVTGEIAIFSIAATRKNANQFLKSNFYKASAIKTVEAFEFDFARFSKSSISIKGAILYLAFILFCTAGMSLFLVTIWGFRISIVWGLLTGLVGGLSGIIIEFMKADIQTKIKPNQGIFLSAKNPILLIIIYSIFSLIICIPIWDEIATLLKGKQVLSIVVMTTIVFIWTGLHKAGGDAIQKHLALRITLYLNDFIPWNYARFLNYCTDRLLLQRVGGRYRFIHKLLQEHFANMPIEK